MGASLCIIIDRQRLNTQPVIADTASPSISIDTLSSLLGGCSIEVSPTDRRSIQECVGRLASRTEVFINSASVGATRIQVKVARELHRAGLVPVPHVIARDIVNFDALDNILGRLVDGACVDRVVVLAGDRRIPAGSLNSSLQIIESRLLVKHGIRKLWLSAYPEGHPSIPVAKLIAACVEKVVAAQHMGLQVAFLTQLCLDAAPALALVRDMRAQRLTCPVRIGIAGPAHRDLLLMHARSCGIGVAAARRRVPGEMGRAIHPAEMPEAFLRDIVVALQTDPTLVIEGIHFFTVSSPAATIDWMRNLLKEGLNA